MRDENEVEARRHTKTTTPSVKFVGMLTVVRLFPPICNFAICLIPNLAGKSSFACASGAHAAANVHCIGLVVLREWKVPRLLIFWSNPNSNRCLTYS